MQNTMASHREISRLTTNMNTIPGRGRPSRNSQGICNVSQHSMGYTTSQSDQQGTPVNTTLPRVVLTKNDPDQDTPASSGTPPSQRQVESFTPCVRQNDRFVNPSGKPLQPGTVIICVKIPFIVSNNGKIYNVTGGSFKQLYVTDPSEHKFLVRLANSPNTNSSIINSVIDLFPRFSSKQTNPDKHKSEHQVQSIIEASNSETLSNNGNKGINVSTDTIPEVDASDLVDLSSYAVHHNVHDNPSLHKDLFQNSMRNEMLTHYNRIVIGCFKNFFQSVNTNNLAEVLQALKELNLMLANRAPELAAHYNIVLEPCQISAEVPKLVKAHLHCNTAYNAEHRVRGRPHSRGNQYHWYGQQLSLLPRYNQQSERSDAHFHSNRNYGNTHHCVNSHCNPPQTVRNPPKTSNNQINTITTQSPNNSDLIGSLQSQILGLQT